MEADAKKPRFPEFGKWESFDDDSMMSYLESNARKGRPSNRRRLPPPPPRCYYFGLHPDGSIFRVPIMAPLYVPERHNPSVPKKEVFAEKQFGRENEGMKREKKNQAKVHDHQIIVRSPKAVDEDLYKISPELLRQKHWKKKIRGGSCWSRCLD